MIRTASLFTVVLAFSQEKEPLLTGWQLSPPAAPAVRAVLPGVHQVDASPREVVVRSAGLSLDSWGPLEANHYDPPAGVRSLAFRFPRTPTPADGRVPVPLGITGAFLTGAPIYQVASTFSYRDQNLWHRDAVAMDPAATPALTALLNAYQRHSPLIGFALDGYPIYGPFGFSAQGRVQRMRSSYRLRQIVHRRTWPDGTALLPGQYGPDPSTAHPLGTFVEDYEYVAGLGDLDEANARFAVTPEYPHGTYAYFLSTDAGGRLAYPYLIGPVYRGRPLPGAPRAQRAEAGVPFALHFDIRNRAGRPQLFLEKRHQKPLHLLVVSHDLQRFFHLHPEPVPGGGFAVTHTFPHGGRYHLYADYAVAGDGPEVNHTLLEVAGPPNDGLPAPRMDRVTASLQLPQPLQSGVDLPLTLSLAEAGTGRPVTDLEPFLDAWAHFVVISYDHGEFLHVHPEEDGAVAQTSETDPHAHAPVTGPSPSAIHASLGFRRPGRYKLWAQFQRGGQVFTQPFELKVAAGPERAPVSVPPGAIRVDVSGAGFAPAEIRVKAGDKVRLAFVRQDAQNCGGTVRFPALGITRALRPGEFALVEFDAPKSGTLAFTCGMGMYQGAVVIR